MENDAGKPPPAMTDGVPLMDPAWPPPQTVANPTPQLGSGFGIASLVLGVLALVPLSVPFGVLGLLGRRSRVSKRLAIAGLTVSALWLSVGLVSIGALLATASTDATPRSNARSAAVASTAAPGPTAVNKLPGYRGLALAGELQVGDCLQMPVELQTHALTFVEINCDQPHNAEVYVKSTLPWALKYPGRSVVVDKVQTVCGRRLPLFLGSRPTLGVTFRYYYPSSTSWSYNTEYSCIAFDVNGPVRGELGSST